MTLPTDIDALSLITKLVAAAGLFALGVVLLVQTYLARRPTRVVLGLGGASRRADLSVTFGVPTVARLGPGSELKRLTSVMDGARVRLDTITASQRAAMRHLDAAEIALNRLLSEIADVMPAAIAPTIVPRRVAVPAGGVAVGAALAA